MLSDREKRRFLKQIMLPETGEKGQDAIRKGRVMVVGAGGLGCPVLQYIVAAGTGTVGIIESAMISESNIHRQILYGYQDIGKLKSIIAKKKLGELSDYSQIEIFNIRLTESNAGKLLEGWDIIIDASDNYETRYILDDICAATNRPMIHGAVHAHEGQVSVFNYRGGPSYRSCNPGRSGQTGHPDPSATGLFGMLPGITGTLMAYEAIKIMTGVGEVMSGVLLTFNISKNTWYMTKISHNKKHSI